MSKKSKVFKGLAIGLATSFVFGTAGVGIGCAVDQNFKNKVFNVFKIERKTENNTASASTFWQERLNNLEKQLEIQKQEYKILQDKFLNLKEEDSIEIAELTKQLEEKQAMINELEARIQEIEDKLLYFAPMSLNCYSWLGIKEISESGKAKDYFKINDEINVQMINGEIITLQIIGFNHDNLSDGSGKAGITFAMKYLLNSTYGINSQASNVGGWKDCDFRNNTLTEILNNLPIELKNSIKAVDKITTNGNKSTETITTSDKLFLFSATEISGTMEGFIEEGLQYEGFYGKSNIKLTTNGENHSGYWTRSPDITHTERFSCMSEYGWYASNTASHKRGICFGFCI